MYKAVSNRYDGVRRNPWNQIEWGNHYTRAMASYSVLLALSGFHYSAVERSVAFQPRITPDSFQSFFAAGSAWGLYSQRRQGQTLTAKLESRHGALSLRRVTLSGGAAAKVTGPGGVELPCTVKSLSDGIAVELAEEVVIPEGKSMTIVTGPDKGVKVS